MKRVLFVCVHNSGRSQMAEAIFNHLAQGQALAESAGTMPGEAVQPAVVEVMGELGLDLKDHRPKALTQEQVAQADRIITMGCGPEGCPVFFSPTEDWGLPDPQGRPLEEVCQVRDRIVEMVEALLQEMGVPVEKHTLAAPAREAR